MAAVTKSGRKETAKSSKNVTVFQKEKLKIKKLQAENRRLKDTINASLQIDTHDDNRLSALIRNGMDNISLLSPNGTLLWESPSAVRPLNYKSDEHIGRDIFTLIHPDDMGWTWKKFKLLVRTPKGQQSGRFRMKHSNGSWRWVEATVTNMLDEPSVNAIVINYRDITERKQTEEEARKHTEDLALINALNSAINQGDNLDVILEIFTREASRMFSCKDATIYMLTEDGKSLVMQNLTLPSPLIKKIEKMIGHPLPPIQIPIREDGYFKNILENDEGTITTDPKVIQEWMQEFSETTFLPHALQGVTRKLIPQIYKLLDISSTMTVPLISAGTAIGLLGLASNAFFTEEDLKRVRDISGQVTEAILRKQAEEKLQESEKRFRNLVETTSDWIWEIDDQGVYTYSSPRVFDLLGYQPGEIIGKTPFDLMPPDEAKRVTSIFSPIATAQRSFSNFENMNLHKDGHSVFLETSGTPILDRDGRFLGYRGIDRDVTERRQADIAMLESEKRYRALYEDTPIAIWEEDFSRVKEYLDSLKQQGVSDLRAYFASHAGELVECAAMIKVLDASNAALRMYKAKTKEALITETHQIVSRGELEHIHEDFIAIAEGRPGNSWEGSDETNTGEPIEISLSWSVLPGHEQDYSKVIVTTIDITARKQAEAKVNQLAAIVQSSDDAIIGKTFDGIVTSWNQGAQKIYGYSESEMIGQPVSILAAPGYEEEIPQILNRIVSGERIEHYETVRRRKDGQDIQMSLGIFPIRDMQGRIVAASTIGRDITSRKRMEMELRKNEERLKHAMHVARLGIWDWNVRTDEVSWYGEMFHVYGVAPEEFTGKGSDYFRFTRADYREIQQENIKKSFERGITETDLLAGKEVEPDPEELCIIRPNGSECYTLEVAVSFVDEDGKPIRMLGITQDITERKQAEREIRDLALIPAENPNPVLRFDQQGRLLYANGASTGLLEFWECKLGEFPPLEWKNRIVEAASSQQRILFEAVSKEHVFSILIVPVKDAAYVNLYGRDITESKRAETELRATHQLLETIFDQTHVLIAYLDQQLNFVRVNRAYALADAREPSYYPGRNHFDLFPNTENEIIFRHVAETGEPYIVAAKAFEYAEHPERGVSHWDWSLMPIKNESGSVSGLILTLVNVTERVKAEEALQMANSYNRSLIEASLDPLVTIGPDGKITDVNTSTETVTGFKRDELIGADFSDYFTEPEKARSGYRQVFHDGMVRNYPLEIVHRNGETTPVLYNATIYHDPAGRVIGVFAAARDITELNKMEKEREQYYKFFETSADLMAIADPNGAFINTNPSCSQMLGYSEMELLSRPFIDFVHIDDRQSTLDEMERQLQTGYSLNFENRYVCKNGTPRWLSWRAQYNREDGLTYATARDITEQKQAEEKLRATLEEKETLLREVHHRVKNNLQAMIALLDMQGRQMEDVGTRTFLKELEGQARTMSLVYEQLYQSENLARVALQSYLKQLTDNILESFGYGQEHQLSLNVEDISLDVAQAMPCGLIINEIYTNILKHAFPPDFKGCREVKIDLHQAEGIIHLTISDNGIGMPPGYDWRSGKSLGLRLVNLWATHQLGGTLEVTSAKGTSFAITFEL